MSRKKTKTIDTNINLDRFFEDDKPISTVQNPPMMPQHPFRLVDAGSSGSGKTTVLFNALITGNLLFDKLYIFAKDLEEKKYVVLIKHYCAVAEEMGISPDELIVVGNTGKDIIKVDDLDPNKVNLIIFDDWLSDKKTMDTIIVDHFIRSRKKNASLCFLAQSYYDIPKKIRLQCDYFILFKFPEAKANMMIISEQKGSLGYEQFKQLFEEATKEKHSWIFIDKKTDDERLKVRKGFHQPLKIMKFEESEDDDNSD